MDTGSAQAGSELGGVGNIFTRQIEQDRKAEKALSSFDVRRSLSVNLSYELPIGRGRPLVGRAGGWLGMLVGGWDLNAIVQVSDGSPAPIYLDFSRSRSLHSRISPIVDLRRGSTIPSSAIAGYYDPTAFVPAGRLCSRRNTLILQLPVSTIPDETLFGRRRVCTGISRGGIQHFQSSQLRGS
jgi:hypothetical protein